MSKTTPDPSYLELFPKNREQWIDLLNRIREARALLLRDAEGFDRAAAVLEHIGQAYARKLQPGLGRYQPALMHLVEAGAPSHLDEARRLFEVVREARNTAIHDGAWVRHLGERLAELFIILEAAISSHMTLVKDMMVAGPTTAQPWQQLADVRRTLLLNSFSYLPVQLPDAGPAWHLLADHHLVSYIANKVGDERRTHLSKPVAEAVQGGLQLIPAKTVSGEDTIDSIRTQPPQTPLLVVRPTDQGPQLVGIITAFDLL